jgi:RimJ/RimL family protein N-acetyltransferase
MLTSARVTLRAIERDDVPIIHAINNDVEVELAGGGDPPWPQSLARAYADFDRQAAEGGRDGNPSGVTFAIEADGKLIGFCGLNHRNVFAATAELGITIGDKEYWGRGYGREAIGLLVDYGFTKLNLRRIYLRVHGRNRRAIRAYNACGFVEEGRLRQHVWSNGAYDDLLYMGIMREDCPAIDE